MASPVVTSRRRVVIYAAAAAITVLIVVAAMAFAHSLSLTRVTNNARSLHWTNATLGTAALTRAGLVQAITFTELAERHLVTAEDLDFAYSELGSAFDELERLHGAGAGHISLDELRAFLDLVGGAMAGLESGDSTSVRETVTGEVEEAFVALSRSLAAEQDVVQAAIADNAAAGRNLNAWVVFALTLAVPATAIVVYYVIARRQMRNVREIARLELEAERTINRAKDSFIAGLSHELRTPLTSIYGFAEVMIDGSVKGAEATRETARLISNEAAEMIRMVDDLLAASRIDSTGLAVDLAPTPLEGVIESAVAPFAGAGHSVAHEPTDLVALVDEGRLRHVLVNLISNACRHGGPKVSVEVGSSDGAVDIEVWDDGDGVPRVQQERLFRRFVHEGSEPLLTGSVGLGLAVASRLATLMGGRLSYRRSAGRTCFTVSVPAVPVTAGVGSGNAEGVAG